jgi:hypothetical protein
MFIREAHMRRAAFHHTAAHLLLNVAFSFLCLSIASATDKNSHKRTIVFQPVFLRKEATY